MIVLNSLFIFFVRINGWWSKKKRWSNLKEGPVSYIRSIHELCLLFLLWTKYFLFYRIYWKCLKFDLKMVPDRTTWKLANAQLIQYPLSLNKSNRKELVAATVSYYMYYFCQIRWICPKLNIYPITVFHDCYWLLFLFRHSSTH